MMKKSVVLICAIALCFAQMLSAQELTDAQKAAIAAAAAAVDAPEVVPEEVKPDYWTESLKTNIKYGQTTLTNWAAGGDNTVTLQAFVDGNANYKKDDLFWNNRLQLDYGFVYASSKPILQKSDDRIYLESKLGYKNAEMKNIYFSANYDFKSQFSTGYDYKTPSVPDADKYKDGEGNLKPLDKLANKDQVDLWKAARVMKSDFLAPAYTNLALGLDYVPTKWLSLNFAPITGGFVIVRKQDLRKSYSMELTKDAKALETRFASYDEAAASEADKKEYAAYQASLADGSAYRAAKFEFGAQLKADAKVNINDNFSYSTQVVLFVNYLDINHCPRINWDNRVDWKLAKYFSLTLTTNLIYDDQIMIKNDKDIVKYPDGRARVQFKESIAFGFTYTIANKK